MTKTTCHISATTAVLCLSSHKALALDTTTNNSMELNELLTQLVNGFSLKFTPLLGHAQSLLYILLSIQLVLFGLYWALGNSNIAQELVKKALLVGGLHLLINRYAWLVGHLRASVVQAGMASSAKQFSLQQLLDPSALVYKGFTLTEKVWASEVSARWWAFKTGDPLFLLAWLTVASLLIAPLCMALQSVLVVSEFYIVSSLAVLLLPFGVLQPTASIADRSVSMLLRSAAKLMVFAFVASITFPLVHSLQFTQANPTFRQSFSLMATLVALALLVCKVPTMVATFMGDNWSVFAHGRAS